MCPLFCYTSRQRTKSAGTVRTRLNKALGNASEIEVVYPAETTQEGLKFSGKGNLDFEIKNPSVANVALQLGGEIKDGHLTFKNPKDEETFRKHLQNLNGGNVKLSVAVENSIDNAENLDDNTDRKINDYLTVTKDGAFKAKLFNEVPLNGEETSQERIKRRENEVANMDKELNLTENPDAYAQLLSDKSINDIENHRHTLGDSWTRTLGHYRKMYQEILQLNDRTLEEENILEQLYTLKGAIRYAERQGKITQGLIPRGNQLNVARTPERIDRTDEKAEQGMGRKAEQEGNRITDTSHSENNQGGFHYEYFHNLKNNALKYSISNNDNSTTSLGRVGKLRK